MWQPIIQGIIATLAPAAITIVSGLVSVGLYQFQKFIKAKTKDQAINEKVDQFDSIVEMAVAEAEQVIRPMLSDGKLDKAERAKIKSIVKRRVDQLSPEDTKGAVQSIAKQLNAYVSAKIEQKVLKMKQEDRQK